MHDSQPYKPASIIPDQASQLVACTYEFMVATCLRHLVSGQECTAVSGCGLYIVRNGDVFRFMVNLNQTGMTMQTKCYVSCNKVKVVWEGHCPQFVMSHLSSEVVIRNMG